MSVSQWSVSQLVSSQSVVSQSVVSQSVSQSVSRIRSILPRSVEGGLLQFFRDSVARATIACQTLVLVERAKMT